MKLFPYQQVAADQLAKALRQGRDLWGYPGCIDMSMTGTGKTPVDITAALSTGRQIAVLCPTVGINGWLKTLQAFNTEPNYVGTPESLKGGNRSGIVGKHRDGTFVWKWASDIVLIWDEAHSCKGDGNVAWRLADAAIQAGIPMICASATLASSPTELRIAGRITGLHQDGADWERFMTEHGCAPDDEGVWKFNRRKTHLLEQLHRLIIPQRGCRMTKEDMGDRPKCSIDVLPIDCPEAPRIHQEWVSAQRQLDDMRKKRYPQYAITAVRRKVRMRLWRMTEEVLVPHVANLMKADLAAGKSVLAFCGFTESRLALGRLLNTRDGFYGGQAQHERVRIEGAFQADRIRVLVSQVKAGGSSVSLHDLNGDHPRVMYLFPSDSAISMGQCPGRIDRAGMLTPAQVWIPAVRGTLSEAMVHSTARKLANMGALNDGAMA